MASARWTRGGASVLVSLLMSVGLTSGVLGATPTYPPPGPIASAPVTSTPTQTIAPTPPPPDGTPAEANSAVALPATTMYQISGTITGWTSLDGVLVEAMTGSYGAGTYTSAGGAYSFPVPAGSYTLWFRDQNARYLNGYYAHGVTDNFTLSHSAATTLVIGSADVIVPNVQLGTGYHIAGTVTGPGGAALGGISVSVSSSAYSSSTVTSPAGYYLMAVPVGVYEMPFHDPSGTYIDGEYGSGFSVAVDALYADTVTVAGDRIINVQMLWPWSTAIYESATSVTVGTSVTLTASVNQDVGLTPYYTSILAGGGVFTSCSSGIACITSVTSSIPASVTYHAVVGRSNGTWPVSTSDTVTVTWTPHHIVVSPATATIAAGASQAYTAEGFDASSNSLGNVTGATTFTIAGGGSCTGASCTSTVPGDHTVTGTDGAATGTATLHVTAASLHHLVLSPATATIAAGASQAYTAEGFDALSNSLGNVTGATTFTISGGGSCTLASCASTVPGDHTVTGTDGSAISTVTLRVIGSTYTALPPKRLLDSRSGLGLSGTFSSHVARTFQVTGGTSGVPANATAITGNLTVTQQTSLGFLYLGPTAANNPTSSTLNFPVGDDRANAVTVALGAGGTLSATYAAPTPGQTAHVIFDVTGYFVLDTSGSTYHALTPKRLLDTRYGTGLSGVFSSHVARTFQVSGGTSGIPANATAVTGNLTVTQQTNLGFLYLGPAAKNDPTSSTLNFPLGDDRANAVTVALADDGTLSATYAAPTLGPTAQVIFDVTGYFTPDMTGATYMPLTPTRILDTRYGTGLSGLLGSHAAKTFAATGGISGVPASATAITGNLTVTQQTSLGFLYLGPIAANDPASSTLNFPLADDRANAVTVALGVGGSLSVTYAAPSMGPTAHVLLDVSGYFVP
jgi:hypothetical protein